MWLNKNNMNIKQMEWILKFKLEQELGVPTQTWIGTVKCHLLRDIYDPQSIFIYYCMKLIFVLEPSKGMESME
jgi:hypothetical protein